MHTLANTAFVATGRRATRPLGLRLLDWLVALDAGYREAHRLASASDKALDDMGISRRAAEAEFARRLGTAGDSRPAGSGW